jgi:hypothetical protein
MADDRGERESESAVEIAVMLLILAGCVAVGAYFGFTGAGIGGAIVGVVVGAVVGFGLAESTIRFLRGLVEAAPALAGLALFIGAVVFAIWGVNRLWGVGKP